MAGTVVPSFIEHRSRGVIRTQCAITTDAAGAASATVVGVGFGRLVSVFYNGGLDVGATVTIADTKTGATLLTLTTGTEGTAASFFNPTTAIVTNAGAAIAASDVAPNINRSVYVAGKVQMTVAGGGNAETGTIALVVDEAGLGDKALTV